jgi:hypothetical protein
VRAVWKYVLRPEHRQTVSMPVGAQILHVDEQRSDGFLCLWALVSAAPTRHEPREILVVGTGHEEVPDDVLYIGTVLMENRLLVWHVFEVTA